MTDHPGSFLVDVADRVVAWHNRHPLAQRIRRSDVQSVGIVQLPYAHENEPAWDAEPVRRGFWTLLFPGRLRRRSWPAFSEDALPEIGLRPLQAFAARHGYHDRPGPADLPIRVLQLDAARLGAPDGQPAPQREERYLVTAAIDAGLRRPRVVLGQGRVPPVLGRRLWSLPRLAGLGGALLLSLAVVMAGLWLKAMTTRGAAAGAAAAASAATRAPAATSAAAAPSAAATAAATTRAPAASAPLPLSASNPAPAVAPASARAPAVPAVPAASASAPAAVASLPAPAAAASPAARHAASASASAPSAAAASAEPALPEVQFASQPLVPRLRPSLGLDRRPPAGASGAAAARAPAPPPLPAPAAAASGAGRALPAPFFALISRPMHSRAEAQALLLRLQRETRRIGHPTATQTALVESPEGWRVTWWPFTHVRQAENARAAMASRRLALEVVEF